MPGGNLNREILFNTIKRDASSGSSNAVSLIKKRFPELFEPQCEDIIGIISGAMEMQDGDKSRVCERNSVKTSDSKE